ncbi:FAD-dependent oxidoreductase [Halobaculum lipolyticum]|uniref:FAD-dependent oxidoreductase n=1 Tax=Halobaculum lipolyticum TaxID=3032001 RepID=A0ABD5W5P8_9EURY|nr:FAD-dependent oxidoreductase [Halobaculum sp. DT31]
MTDPVVVVGGDAAGLSAASKLAREDPDRAVIVFERGAWVSYAHCGIPYYVKGEVDRLDDLLSLTPDEVDDRGIDLRRNHEVVAVDTDAGSVRVEGPDGAFDRPYGDLVVATGARARSDPVSGSDLDGAFTVHGLDSAATIRAALTPPAAFAVEDLGGEDFVDREAAEHYGAMDPPETAAIVGGGYVGVEMAEALSAWDLDVHLFQRSSLPLAPFGDAVGEAVADHLADRDVTLHLGESVRRLLGDGGRVSGLVCDDGTTLDVGLAVVGVGVAPNVEVLADTPVELGDSGAVAVDEYGETSVPGVYAAGDCAEDRHVVTGAPAWVPLGLTANRAGRAIGATLAGTPTEVGRIAGTAVVKAFDQECGRAGIVDPERARREGFDPVAETVTAGSRSGYYPGNAETTVTLVADRDSGRLLGGSIVGTDRAAIRIDTVATALEAGLTVGEVERLDLAYAPPFSPVWDPVLVAAKVLGGSLDG